MTDTLSSTFIKCISDPFDFIFPLAGNQNCIEAAGKVAFMFRQIMTGGAYQFGLLGGGDAGGCATKPITGAHPDFDEHVSFCCWRKIAARCSASLPLFPADDMGAFVTIGKGFWIVSSFQDSSMESNKMDILFCYAVNRDISEIGVIASLACWNFIGTVARHQPEAVTRKKAPPINGKVNREPQLLLKECDRRIRVSNR